MISNVFSLKMADTFKALNMQNKSSNNDYYDEMAYLHSICYDKTENDSFNEDKNFQNNNIKQGENNKSSNITKINTVEVTEEEHDFSEEMIYH